jgi:apolipoprotein N-acyltransferase
VLNNHAAATHALAARVRAGNAKPPDLVIWPENSTDIDPFSDRTVYAQIEAAVRDIGVPTLVGAVIGGPDGNHDQNVGIVWDPRTGPGERYVKRHVVPFGEYIPFRSLLTRFISRLNQIPVDFAPGHTPGVLQVGPATVGDVICFEVAYDGLVRDVINGGGQVLVVQTNNATYTGTGQLVQQFAISRYRAIETGRTVVIAATSGISGIVAPDGSVVAATAVGTRAVLDDPVRLATGVTPGVRFGGTLDIVLSALGIGLAGAARLGLRWRVGTMAT